MRLFGGLIKSLQPSSMVLLNNTILKGWAFRVGVRKRGGILSKATSRLFSSSSLCDGDKWLLEALVSQERDNEKLWATIRSQWLSTVDDISTLCTDIQRDSDDVTVSLDLLERLTESRSPQRYSGYLSILDSAMGSNQLEGALAVFWRLHTGQYTLNVAIVEALAQKLVSQCLFTDFQDVIDTHEVTASILCAAAQPLVMSGMPERFLRLLSKFLKNGAIPSGKELQQVLTELVAARWRRAQSARYPSKAELLAYYRIYNELHTFIMAGSSSNRRSGGGSSEEVASIGLENQRVVHSLIEWEDYMLELNESIDTVSRANQATTTVSRQGVSEPRLCFPSNTEASSHFAYVTEDRVPDERRRARRVAAAKGGETVLKDLTLELARYETAAFPIHLLYASALFPGDHEREMQQLRLIGHAESRKVLIESLLQAGAALFGNHNSAAMYLRQVHDNSSGNLAAGRAKENADYDALATANASGVEADAREYTADEEDEDDDEDEDEDEDDEDEDDYADAEDEDDNDLDEYDFDGTRVPQLIQIEFEDPDEGSDIMMADSAFEDDIFRVGTGDLHPSIQLRDLTTSMRRMYRSLVLEYSPVFFATASLGSLHADDSSATSDCTVEHDSEWEQR